MRVLLEEGRVLHRLQTEDKRRGERETLNACVPRYPFHVPRYKEN